MKIATHLLLAVILVMWINVLAVYDSSEIVPQNQFAAAAPNLSCLGGEVFVYSKDFSDMSEEASRPAQVRKFTCYRSTQTARGLVWARNTGGYSINFKQNKVLMPVDACLLLPLSSAPQCAVAYYAVVPNLPVAAIDYMNPNNIPSKLEGERCALKSSGQMVRYADCVAIERKIKATRMAQLQPTERVPSIDPIQTPKPNSIDRFLKQYESYGSPKPFRAAPNSTMPSGAPVPGRSTVWGLTFTWPLN